MELVLRSQLDPHEWTSAASHSGNYAYSYTWFLLASTSKYSQVAKSFLLQEVFFAKVKDEKVQAMLEDASGIRVFVFIGFRT